MNDVRTGLDTGRTLSRLDQLIDEAALLIEEIRQEAARQLAARDQGNPRKDGGPCPKP